MSDNKTRPAWLFSDWHKSDVPRPVTWHAWGQLSDDNGGEPCAIVEHVDGEVQTVAADRLRFADALGAEALDAPADEPPRREE